MLDIYRICTLKRALTFELAYACGHFTPATEETENIYSKSECSSPSLDERMRIAGFKLAFHYGFLLIFRKIH